MSGDERRHEGRPDDWLFHILTRIEDQQTRHAAEIRTELQLIRSEMAKHQLEDALVAAEVRSLKTRLDHTSTTKRHVQTLMLSTGLVAVWEGTKVFAAHFFGWK